MKAILKSDYRYNTATLFSGKGFSKNHPTELPDELMAEVQAHPYVEVYVEPEVEKSEAASISDMSVAEAIAHLKTIENLADLAALRDEEMAGKGRVGVLRYFDTIDLEGVDLVEDEGSDLDDEEIEVVE